ncbi:MAG: hypothetical protein QME96_10925 [Myxococcota bacterium]|nr:hypothetical protein [Myxococcota bacterium]
MQTQFRGKHFVTEQEWTREEIDTAIDVSFDLKRRFAMGEPHRLLPDKTAFMALQHVADRRRPAADAGRGLSVALPEQPLLPEDLLRFPHGHSLRGHRTSSAEADRLERLPSVAVLPVGAFRPRGRRLPQTRLPLHPPVIPPR